MFKQIAYPCLVSAAGSSALLTLTAPGHQPSLAASSTRSRDFPWLWVLLLTSLGLIVWWLVKQGPIGRTTLWNKLTGLPATPVGPAQVLPEGTTLVATPIDQVHPFTYATPGAMPGSSTGVSPVDDPSSAALSGDSSRLTSLRIDQLALASGDARSVV